MRKALRAPCAPRAHRTPFPPIAAATVVLPGGGSVGMAAQRQARAKRYEEAQLAPVEAGSVVAVAGVVDSARKTLRPTEPLGDRALEGAKKGAEGARIVTAVRGLFS